MLSVVQRVERESRGSDADVMSMGMSSLHHSVSMAQSMTNSVSSAQHPTQSPAALRIGQRRVSVVSVDAEAQPGQQGVRTRIERELEQLLKQARVKCFWRSQ